MGLLSFIFPQNEERLRQGLNELIHDYYQIKSGLEEQRILTEQLKVIRARVASINASIKHTSTIADKKHRMIVLQDLLNTEKTMLAHQKTLAQKLGHSSMKIEKYAHKARRTASKFRK